MMRSRRIVLALLLSQACALVPPCACRRRPLLRAEPDKAPVQIGGAPPPVQIGGAPPAEISGEGPTAAEATGDVAIDAAAAVLSERQKEMARLRAAEKFMEKDTGQYFCKVCEYTYDPAEGAKGVAADTPFDDIQSNWRCPRCRASKDSFEPVTITIAGFAENQDYGFGGNSMTEEQKTLYIFGGIGFFFVLLLSGYLLT